MLISFRSINEAKFEKTFNKGHDVDTIQTHIIKPAIDKIQDLTEPKNYQASKKKKKKRKKRQNNRRRCLLRKCNVVRYY